MVALDAEEKVAEGKCRKNRLVTIHFTKALKEFYLFFFQSKIGMVTDGHQHALVSAWPPEVTFLATYSVKSVFTLGQKLNFLHLMLVFN